MRFTPALLVYMVWSWRTLASGSTSLSCDPRTGLCSAASRHFLKRRESIARKNLELCFPQYNAQQRETLIAENFKSIGMALLETGMAGSGSALMSASANGLTWKALRKLKRVQMQNRGVMVVGVHFMSLELGGRVMGLCQPMMATYRPHNSPLMEWVQTRGRMCSNKAR